MRYMKWLLESILLSGTEPHLEVDNIFLVNVPPPVSFISINPLYIPLTHNDTLLYFFPWNRRAVRSCLQSTPLGQAGAECSLSLILKRSLFILQPISLPLDRLYTSSSTRAPGCIFSQPLLDLSDTYCPEPDSDLTVTGRLL